MKKMLVLAAASMLSTVAFASGEDIYNKACTNCHSAAVAPALGAPAAHDAAAWAPRLEKGMDALLASVKNGKGAMPPTGLCGDCSDEDFKAAIEFMSK